MAEGGYEFENPEFDRDDYDKDETDEKSFMDEEDFQRTLNNQYKALDDLKGNTLEEHTTKLLKMLVKRFYERNQEAMTLDVDEAEWNIRNDGRGRPILYLEVDGIMRCHIINQTNLMLFYSSIRLTHFKENMVLVS